MTEASLEERSQKNALDSASRPSVLQVSRPFFTSSELSYLHSFTVPDSRKLTFNQRKHQIFQYLFQVVKILKFPLRVLGNAMNYYQRWYLFNKFEEMNSTADLENDPYTIALTCLFLASKNEDTIKKLKDLQTVGNKLRDDKSILQQSYLDMQRRAIMGIEFKLLQVIKFDFINGSSIQSTDQLVVQFSKKLGIDYKTTMFSWLVTFDLMSTPLSLMIPPHCITLAALIVTLNVKPKEMNVKYSQEDETEVSTSKLNEVLENIDCYRDFRCPETFVNEGIVYILDYYVHQLNFSILNEFMPSVDPTTGKEQIFKFMELKSRFNDLVTLDRRSCFSESLLKQDEYLSLWDYSIGAKGSVRFVPGNKRRRFDLEVEKVLASQYET